MYDDGYPMEEDDWGEEEKRERITKKETILPLLAKLWKIWKSVVLMLET